LKNAAIRSRTLRDAIDRQAGGPKTQGIQTKAAIPLLVTPPLRIGLRCDTRSNGHVRDDARADPTLTSYSSATSGRPSCENSVRHWDDWARERCIGGGHAVTITSPPGYPSIPRQAREKGAAVSLSSWRTTVESSRRNGCPRSRDLEGGPRLLGGMHAKLHDIEAAEEPGLRVSASLIESAYLQPHVR